MLATGLVIFEAGWGFLKVLNLPLACHPLGMSLGCRLERLVVGASLQPIPRPLPVDSIEDITNEGGILGGGRSRHMHQ